MPSNSPAKLVRQALTSRRQAGFSLPEITIILALVATLVGSVVLGNGLVTQGRTRALAHDLNALTMAIAIYGDRYRALPGDDPEAEIRWPGKARNGTGDRRISGAYQAFPPAGDALTALIIDPSEGESLNFWWHLRLADLIVAPPTPVSPVAQPLDQYYGVIGVEWGALGFPGLGVCAANIPGDVAIGVDTRLDDGDPRRGFVRAARQSSENQPLAAADATVPTFASADTYVLCQRID